MSHTGVLSTSTSSDNSSRRLNARVQRFLRRPFPHYHDVKRIGRTAETCVMLPQMLPCPG